MTGQRVVPFGGDSQENATLLLAAADDLGLDPSVIGTSSEGFLVPQEVLDKAGLEDSAVPLEEVPTDGNSDEEEEAPAEEPKKKTAAKAAKKAPSKPANKE